MSISKQGSLSINSENIFPIIKKWLYSDQDIFVRELISNGCDAITKLKKLDMISEYQLPDDYKPSINVIVNSKDKTLKFIDNGIGMTASEVEEYINQIAFSGATEFLNKYKDKTNDDQIIGHFGLGFYSAFMVSDSVEIDTLSYENGASAVHWECDGGTEFEMTDGSWDQVGTMITLHLNEDCLEYSNEYRVREVIEKYCSFMPVPIYITKADAPQEFETIDEADLKEDDVVVEKIHEDAKDGKEASDKVKINKRPVALNDTTPLWMKHPNECTDEDYKAFYRKVFKDYKEPLFWIHLNMDYPFNLKGILYFPKINIEYESLEGVIKLYNNQVFIADNIKEVIPEFLMLLKGVIDCPDLPLNVSRSALQNDGFVKKISDYITKKVSDKLSGMCKVDRENYEKYWDDLSPFIKFGCIKDEKFCEKMVDYVLFKDLDHKYMTLSEYKDSMGWKAEETESAEAVDENGNKIEAEVVSDGSSAVDSEGNKVEADIVDDGASSDADIDNEAKEPDKNIIYFVSDEKQQSQYINMFREQHMNAVIMEQNIDQPFANQLEYKNEDISFRRIDSDLNDSLVEEIDDADKEAFEKDGETIVSIVRKALNDDKLEVKIEKIRNEAVASMITLSDEDRRMEEMMKMYQMQGMNLGDMGGSKGTLVLNANHPLVKYVLEHKRSKNVPVICQQLYDLARLSHKPLTAEEMTAFIARSNEILMILTK